MHSVPYRGATRHHECMQLEQLLLPKDRAGCYKCSSCPVWNCSSGKENGSMWLVLSERDSGRAGLWQVSSFCKVCTGCNMQILPGRWILQGFRFEGPKSSPRVRGRIAPPLQCWAATCSSLDALGKPILCPSHTTSWPAKLNVIQLQS